MSAPIVHLGLDGTGPLGIAAVETSAFVVLEGAGQVVILDLVSGSVDDRVEIGAGAMLVDANHDLAIVGRYSAPDGKGLLVLSRASGEIAGIATPELAGIALNGPDRAWVLGGAGEVAMVDLAGRQVTASTTIDVHELEHLNGVATGGSFFASSDTTAVRRLDIAGPIEVTATIETGGGIPFVVDGGLVWGARADELWAIDPQTNTVTRRIPLDGLIEILALDVDVTSDQAWIAARKPGRIGTVVALDLSTGAVLDQWDAALPAGVVIVGDRAWVTDYERNELLGIVRPRLSP
jgi:hypothetical protein